MSEEYHVKVFTGDQLKAGTNADVYLILHDIQGLSSRQYKLNNWLRNDFGQSGVDDFALKIQKGSVILDRIHKIEIWRNNHWFTPWWFVKDIIVLDVQRGITSVFPIQRWIKKDVHYVIKEFDTCIPQLEENNTFRKVELEEKRNRYMLICHHPGLPAQVKNMPEDEMFTSTYLWERKKYALKLKLSNKFVKMLSSDWENLEDVTNVYNYIFSLPIGAINWRDDFNFARQRTHSCSIGLIRLCTGIPDKLGVTDEMLKPLLEGLTIAEAINIKRLFMIDLKILEGMIKKENYYICSPIALFFENKDKKLIPVAIQLEQQAGPDNPVFLPTDPEYTWLSAKMWYNNADAQYHQACTHLGFTHLLMEGICVSAHRQLSQSHPIFKILAPHFLYLIAINSSAVKTLVSVGGVVDNTLNAGHQGFFDIMNRGLPEWRVDVDGTIPELLAERGFKDGTLSDFPYRDDALLVYDIIRRYVKKYVDHYYDTLEKLSGDWELQAWAKEVVLDKSQGGVGIKGVPGDGYFTNNEQLIIFISCFISTCSVSHAATHFPQYDEYAFPPNYPATLRGLPPKNKDPLKEVDILKQLPDKAAMLDIMVFNIYLNDRSTKSLGDFEVSYVVEPRAKQFVREFREDLKQAGKIIDERNKSRNPQYTALHPDMIPNSISI